MIKNIKHFLLLVPFLVGLRFASAAESPAPLGDVEMNWPGIHYQIMFIKRIPPNRLLVGVGVLATAKAPPGGTLIGFPVPIPPNADPHAIASGAYHPRPLTLTSSVMVDDLTQTKYPALAPIAPPGRAYVPGEVLGFLKPNHNLFMSVQFLAPPLPPPPAAGQPPVKPTISFLLTNAKSIIKNLAIPAPDAH